MLSLRNSVNLGSVSCHKIIAPEHLFDILFDRCLSRLATPARQLLSYAARYQLNHSMPATMLKTREMLEHIQLYHILRCISINLPNRSFWWMDQGSILSTSHFFLAYLYDTRQLPISLTLGAAEPNLTHLNFPIQLSQPPYRPTSNASAVHWLGSMPIPASRKVK